MRGDSLGLIFSVALCGLACSSGSGGGTTSGTSGGVLPDAGAPALTVDGGTLSDLRFAVVGDTRPQNADQNGSYPQQVINQIYGDLAMLSPAPLFAVSTGDYEYATPGSGNSPIQIGDYLSAAHLFHGTLFAAMGNHECTGYTDSECGPNGADGLSENYTTFLAKMAVPLGATTPYYSVPLKAADGSWTAKIVVTAANAWDSTQQAWLTQAMAETTDYTFVVRHEPSADAYKLSAIGAIDSVIGGKYTLLLVGHTHTFDWPGGGNELVVGNGGVPNTTGGYGFAIISLQPDKSLLVEQYDETSGMPTPGGVSFKVQPNGQVVN